MKTETLDRVLLQGGTVVDPHKGSMRRADLLVVGGKIEKVETGIAAAGAEVIDCRGKNIEAVVVKLPFYKRPAPKA